MLRLATGLSCLAIAAVVGACGGVRPSHEAQRKPDAQAAVAREEPRSAPGSLADFDQVVTLEVLFPEPAVRSLYQAAAPEQRGQERSYSFALKQQPGMEESRHFHFITVAVSPRGERPVGEVSGTGGPGGGFVELPFHTTDGRFEGRVSEGMLLPDSVKLPRFDLQRAAQAVSARYEALHKRE